jgi:hypothetical protein
MFGILLSAFNTILGFVFRSLIVKFVLYFGLYFVSTEFITVISSLFPSASSINSGLGGLSSGFWYFADICAFSQGLPIVLSAWLTRFIIHRVPLIG